MDYKTLVNRFTKACYRFEALQENLDILLFDTDDEIKYNEYEDLASQAAEIVLKLSANGHNVGEHFFNYYVRRLEYIVAYFRELFDDEETPLAEDEPNEPAADAHLEAFPAGCVFPKPPTFVFQDREFQCPPTAKDEENDAVDEGAPISDDDLSLPPGVEGHPENLWLCWDKLTCEERRRVKDSVALFYWLDDIAAQDDESPAAPFLSLADSPHTLLRHYIRLVTEQSILAEERELRRLLWEAIDAIPDLRDSEDFKTIIELYPTYKEELQ